MNQHQAQRLFNEKEIAMLVLSRNTEQSILIGGDVEVTVLEIKGNQVRIGIKAPEDIPVLFASGGKR
jgi:carbon storage regulator